MARKAQSFKLDEKKKAIILYTNVDQNPAEKAMIDYYLKGGYTPMFAEKKEGVTVTQMRADMAAYASEGDEESAKALERFNAAYKEKAKKGEKAGKSGFHKACGIYAEWKKTHKENKF